jgi:hypothetical protein
MLEVEIVPGDQQRVQTPTEGEAVAVTGPWVLDTVHGWNEIHPAWTVEGSQPTAALLPSSGNAGRGTGQYSQLVAAISLAFGGMLLLASGAAVRRAGR